MVRIGVYVLMVLVLAALLVWGLGLGMAQAQTSETDPVGMLTALLVLAFLFVTPVAAVGGLLLALLAWWQGGRLRAGERVAAFLVAVGGFVPALWLLVAQVLASVRG